MLLKFRITNALNGDYIHLKLFGLSFCLVKELAYLRNRIVHQIKKVIENYLK
jgi:hypothetical protein